MTDGSPDLDGLTELYIEKYHMEDFEELRKLLLEQEQKIQKPMEEYDREIKKAAYEELERAQ